MKAQNGTGYFMFLIIVLTLFISPSLLFSATMHELEATSFQSNGVSVYGWYWLNSPGRYAKWTFVMPGVNLLHGATGMGAICVSGLSTDRANGGAGFDSKLKLKLWGRVKTITLKNECPLLKNLEPSVGSIDSKGIGYASHGCIRYKIPRSGHFTITATYPGGHHTAVKKDSMKIIYITSD